MAHTSPPSHLGKRGSILGFAAAIPDGTEDIYNDAFGHHSHRQNSAQEDPDPKQPRGTTRLYAKSPRFPMHGETSVGKTHTITSGGARCPATAMTSCPNTSARKVNSATGGRKSTRNRAHLSEAHRGVQDNPEIYPMHQERRVIVGDNAGPTESLSMSLWQADTLSGGLGVHGLEADRVIAGAAGKVKLATGSTPLVPRRTSPRKRAESHPW